MDELDDSLIPPGEGYNPDDEAPYGEEDTLLDQLKFEKVGGSELCFDANLQPIPCDTMEPIEDE